jgi:iron complex outermembrane receptor protein
VLSWILVPPALAASGVASAQMEEIVVTAQRRAENMQDVPITVSAMTADTLETLGAVDVMDLASIAPGLYVTSARVAADLPARHRHDEHAGRQESLTALYVDGVYYAELPGSTSRSTTSNASRY